MKLALSAVAVATLCAAPVWAQSDKSNNTETHDTRPEPPMLGKHLAKGQQKQASGAAAQSNLLYHGGPVMTNGAVVRTIFWGSSWTTSNSKIAGLASFYLGVGNTPYLQTTDEFTQSSDGKHVNPTVSYVTGYVDRTSVGRRAPSTTAVQNEVCKVLQAQGVAPVTNGYYPVYVDQGRGHNGYCAWHSWGSCGGTQIQFAFFFNLDGDPGCDPGDGATGNSQGLAALANVSGHELSETLTDPRGNGWYDNGGAENSDKCAWTFGHTYVTFGNSTHWKVQGNFSNLANNATHGYTDIDGAGFQQGCIDDVGQR